MRIERFYPMNYLKGLEGLLYMSASRSLLKMAFNKSLGHFKTTQCGSLCEVLHNSWIDILRILSFPIGLNFNYPNSTGLYVSLVVYK